MPVIVPPGRARPSIQARRHRIAAAKGDNRSHIRNLAGEYYREANTATITSTSFSLPSRGRVSGSLPTSPPAPRASNVRFLPRRIAVSFQCLQKDCDEWVLVIQRRPGVRAYRGVKDLRLGLRDGRTGSSNRRAGGVTVIKFASVSFSSPFASLRHVRRHRLNQDTGSGWQTARRLRQCPLKIKMRRTRIEHLSAGLPPISDIAQRR